MIEAFLDTNILLYAASKNPAEKQKTLIAQSIVESLSWGWSAQVAAEFYRAGTSARQTKPLTSSEAQEWIETWIPYPLVAIDGPLVLEAIRISQRFQISYFDGQILAAARQMQCKIVYSEDLNHEQNYGEVQVINPFR